MDETANRLFLDRAIPRTSDVRRSPQRSQAQASEAAAPDEQSWDLTSAFIAKSLVATFLWLASGAILMTSNALSNAICAAALACTLAGITIMFLARRQLRRALIEREIARGASRERAEEGAEAELERITSKEEINRFYGEAARARRERDRDSFY
jgi:hypothetical protein